MRIIKIAVVAIVIVLGLGTLVAFNIDHFARAIAETVDEAYQEQRFEDMFERDRLEKIRCSKMSKKQKLAEMCPQP